MQTHLITRIFTNNPTPAFAKDTHMPDDVKQINRTLAKVKAGTTPVATDYMPLEAIGATTYDIVFNPEDVGLEGSLITNYVSPTGEVGPPSKPVTFIII